MMLFTIAGVLESGMSLGMVKKGHLMTSIITNNSAMAALSTLRSINMDLDTTQSRISSGLRVETAKDNAAYWSIATTMRSDSMAMSTVEDALGLGAAKVDTAYTGMDSSIEVVQEIKNKLVAAREPGVDKTKVDSELTALKEQLKSISDSASFSGENWLKNTGTSSAASKEIVGGFNRASNGDVSITKLTVKVADTILIDTGDHKRGILTKNYNGATPSTNPAAGAANLTAAYRLIDVTGVTASQHGQLISLSSSTTDTQIDEMVSVVDHILTNMTTQAANLGSTNKRIEMQTDFVGELRNSIDSGIGKLVDADMNEESTRLKALQTQQQLGVQALSIANSSTSNIMSLFR